MHFVGIYSIIMHIVLSMLIGVVWGRRNIWRLLNVAHIFHCLIHRETCVGQKKIQSSSTGDETVIPVLLIRSP